MHYCILIQFVYLVQFEILDAMAIVYHFVQLQMIHWLIFNCIASVTEECF